MVYITKANSKRILKKTELDKVPDILEEVYNKPIYFLSKYETKYLLLMKELYRNPELFFIEYYASVTNFDTFTYIFESNTQPSYHYDKDCEKLKLNFHNLEIPKEIKERARFDARSRGLSDKDTEELVIKQVFSFRKWFKANIEIFATDKQKFLRILEARWNVKRRIEEIEFTNSGYSNIDNLNLNELESEIDKLIEESGNYYNQNKEERELIRRFQKVTFLAYKKDRIIINDTGISDEDLRHFLKKYHIKFKKPIMDLLVQYYRVKYNPDLSFEGKFLDRLNFRPCFSCQQKNIFGIFLGIFQTSSSYMEDEDIETEEYYDFPY